MALAQIPMVVIDELSQNQTNESAKANVTNSTITTQENATNATEPAKANSPKPVNLAQQSNDKNMNLQSDTSPASAPVSQTNETFLLKFMANHPWTIAIISFGSVFLCCLITQFIATCAKKSRLQINRITTLKKYEYQQML